MQCDVTDKSKYRRTEKLKNMEKEQKNDVLVLLDSRGRRIYHEIETSAEKKKVVDTDAGNRQNNP